MFGTTVPKASIDENRDALRWEDNVDLDTARFEFDVAVFTKTQT